MKVFITQLIYIKEGAEEIFDEFESIAIPIISKYNGKLLFRFKPNQQTVIVSSVETPYEIHLVEFASDADFEAFMKDDERKKFLHLKEASIRASVLIKGNQL